MQELVDLLDAVERLAEPGGEEAFAAGGDGVVDVGEERVEGGVRGVREDV